MLSNEGGEGNRTSPAGVQGRLPSLLLLPPTANRSLPPPKDNPRSPPKALDLSNELLSHGAVEALADLLSVDWGLKKLVLDSCGLDDEVRVIPAARPAAR